MKHKKYENTPITEEEYEIINPNTKRYYKGNRPLYDDIEREEENLEFMLSDDE
jgi:hypothetical protein